MPKTKNSRKTPVKKPIKTHVTTSVTTQEKSTQPDNPELAPLKQQLAINQQLLGAKYYQSGLQFEYSKDFKLALDEFEKGVKEGSLDCLWAVGRFNQEGLGGLAVNEKKAYLIYKHLANKEYTNGVVDLALCYRYGKGIDKNLEEAARYIKAAADQGSGLAQFELSRILMTGEGIKQNYPLSLKYLKLAAAQTNPRISNANFYLGHSYSKTDPVKAAEHYQIDADLGNLEAQTCLGSCYITARGVIKDLEKGFRYLKNAADKNNANAQYLLGCYLLIIGENMPYDICLGIRYLKKATIQNHVDAPTFLKETTQTLPPQIEHSAVELLELALKGLIDKPTLLDEIRAVEYLHMASEKGHAEATYYLGLCYTLGFRVVQDEAKGMKYFTEAAELEQIPDTETTAKTAPAKTYKMAITTKKYNLIRELGNNQFSEKRFLLAIAIYKKVVDLDNTDINSLANWGVCEMESGQTKDALFLFQRAVKIDPTHEKSVYKIVECSTKLNDLKHAVSILKTNDKILERIKREQTHVDSPAWKRNACKAYLDDLQKSQLPLNEKIYLGQALINKGQFEEAVSLFEEASNLGYGEGILELGLCYLEGWHVAKNPSRAFELFTSANKAFELTNSGQIGVLGRGYTYMGLCHIYGIGTEIDEHLGINIIQIGMGSNDLLAEMYMNSYDSAEKLIQLTHHFKEKKLNVFAQAMLNAAEKLQKVNEIKVEELPLKEDKKIDLIRAPKNSRNKNTSAPTKTLKVEQEKREQLNQTEVQSGALDDKKTFSYYLSAANKNDALAQYDVAKCYFYGEAVEKNLSLAVKFLELAIAHKNIKIPGAHFLLGMCYLEGKGKPQIGKKAIEHFQIDADIGHAESEVKIGYCYLYGEMVGKDVEKGLSYLIKASEKNHLMAHYYIGTYIILHARDLVNPIIPMRSLKKSADQGHLQSLSTLGVAYLDGCGVIQDFELAVTCFTSVVNSKKSIVMRSACEAEYYLGICMIYGLGCKKNLKDGINYVRQAAGKKFQKAQQYLDNPVSESFNLGREKLKINQYSQALKFFEEVERLMNEPNFIIEGNELLKIQLPLGLQFCKANLGKEKPPFVDLTAKEAFERGYNRLLEAKASVIIEFTAMEFLHVASEKGYKEATFYLGFCYSFGFKVPKNEIKGLGYISEVANQIPNAALLKEAIESKCQFKSIELYNALGKQFLSTRLLAKEFFKRALSLGNNKESCFYLGLCEWESQLRNEALGYLEQALRLDPSYYQAALKSVEYYTQLNDVGKALTLLESHPKILDYLKMQHDEINAKKWIGILFKAYQQQVINQIQENIEKEVKQPEIERSSGHDASDLKKGEKISPVSKPEIKPIVPQNEAIEDLKSEEVSTPDVEPPVKLVRSKKVAKQRGFTQTKRVPQFVDKIKNCTQLEEYKSLLLILVWPNTPNSIKVELADWFLKHPEFRFEILEFLEHYNDSDRAEQFNKWAVIWKDLPISEIVMEEELVSSVDAEVAEVVQLKEDEKIPEIPKETASVPSQPEATNSLKRDQNPNIEQNIPQIPIEKSTPEESDLKSEDPERPLKASTQTKYNSHFFKPPADPSESKGIEEVTQLTQEYFNPLAELQIESQDIVKQFTAEDFKFKITPHPNFLNNPAYYHVNYIEGQADTKELFYSMCRDITMLLVELMRKQINFECAMNSQTNGLNIFKANLQALRGGDHYATTIVDQAYKNKFIWKQELQKKHHNHIIEKILEEKQRYYEEQLKKRSVLFQMNPELASSTSEASIGKPTLFGKVKSPSTTFSLKARYLTEMGTIYFQAYSNVPNYLNILCNDAALLMQKFMKKEINYWVGFEQYKQTIRLTFKAPNLEYFIQMKEIIENLRIQNKDYMKRMVGEQFVNKGVVEEERVYNGPR